MTPGNSCRRASIGAKDSVTFVNPVEGASVSEGVTNNATVVLPSFRDLTNGMHGGDRDFPPPEPHRTRQPTTNGLCQIRPPTAAIRAGRHRTMPATARTTASRRPPWLRWMSDADFKALAATHELHGLVLAMSTDNYRAVCVHDLWLRFVIVFFAGISAVGAGLALRNISKTAELQIRLVRASELNSHLKEMNLAAAGLAHETRNPLNIIRGLAQMLSKAEPTRRRKSARRPAPSWTRPTRSPRS